MQDIELNGRKGKNCQNNPLRVIAKKSMQKYYSIYLHSLLLIKLCLLTMSCKMQTKTRQYITFPFPSERRLYEVVSGNFGT